MEKVHTSAVVIIPPVSVWSQIQNIRRQHDKAYDRWMPHINLLYPFLLDQDRTFRDVGLKLSQFLSDFQPFYVKFSPQSFGFFKFGSRSSVHLTPLVGENAVDSRSVPGKAKDQHIKDNKKKEMVVKKHVTATPKSLNYEKKPLLIRSKPLQPGLENLKYAVWTESDNLTLNERTPENSKSGLDCLRFAVWGYEDKDFAGKSIIIAKQHTPKPMASTTSAKFIPDSSESSSDTSEEEDENSSDWTSTESEEEYSDNESINECTSEWTISGMQDTKISLTKTKATTHPNIISLQRKLEISYPDCNDLRTKSVEGFQPHLTLGQFSSRIVEDKIQEMENNWETVEFLVDEIHLISRKGQYDPFAIRYTIPLGAKI